MEVPKSDALSRKLEQLANGMEPLNSKTVDRKEAFRTAKKVFHQSNVKKITEYIVGANIVKVR